MRRFGKVVRMAGGLVLAVGIARAPVAAFGAPASARIDAASLVKSDDPVLGNAHGTVTIVDFYDIRCVPCRAANLAIEKLLKTDHFIRYVPIDYPLLGQASVVGAKALLGAAIQGQYAALHEILMHQTAIPSAAVLEHDAESIGLDWPRLEIDMDGDRVAAHLEANMRLGRALGIKRVPVLFIGSQRINGALSYQDLRSVVGQAEKAAAGHTRS
ncbi:MAG: thioredoxin domain-containing protein [Acetobacteraceae bacterium]